MNLKDFLSNRDKPPELFWSLVLEPGWVQAGLWFIKGSEAQVVAVGPASQWESDDNLIRAADAALSSTIQKVFEEIKEPSKTVFGVPSSWVSGGEIKEEFLDKIKKICTELSLDPVGFVVLPEAIAHLYKSEEGAPISAIIIGISRESLEITIFKLGDLIGTTSVARSVSLIEDVNEGLSRFEGAFPLPSRFIVYDGREGEIDEACNNLLATNWEDVESVKFLHTPKAESLNAERKVFAVSLAGASEIGNADRLITKDEEAEFIPDEKRDEIVNVVEPQNPISISDLGFAIGEDVSVISDQPQNKEVPIQNPKQKFSFAKIKNILHSLSGKISFSKTKINLNFGKKRLQSFAFVGIFTFVGILIFWWFYPKSKIFVYVSPKNYDSETQVIIDTTGVFDLKNGVIPGRLLDTKVKGSKTLATTGLKLVGDKAKGTVEIANGNPDTINISQGTILSSLSGSGIQFVTDVEASVSGQTVPGRPGKATLPVTAVDIGAQFNIAKGEVFSVGDYDSHLLAATAINDFSGGTSQQISAVSEDDQKKLEKELMDELTNKALDNINSQASSGEIVIPTLISSNKITESFSSKVGDEATNLKLDLELDSKGLAVDRSKLIEFSKNILKDKVPQGFVLRDDQIEYKFAFINNKPDRFVFKVIISANFLPAVQTEKIINQISGKTIKAAETYFSNIPGFRYAEIKIISPFPSFLRVLPMIKSHINLDIVSKKLD